MLLVSLSVFAQSNQGKAKDAGNIALAVVVPEQIEGITPIAKSNLENKLKQIALKNGVAGSALNQRFILTANINVLTKDITATAPPMQAYTLEVSLYIGDGIEGDLFSSTTVTLKGVGETEAKAYIAALKNLKIDAPQYQSFIDQGKKKIVEYYNSKCNSILKEAEVLAGQNEFDAAIAKLVSVPEASQECYTKAINAVPSIYQKRNDRECKLKLQEAQGIWSASQDIAAAENAARILSLIEPNASCFAEVKALNKRIEARVKEINNREWKYVLKEQARKSELIEAYRAIGVAYGNNQPQNVTYNYRGWW
jgi:hypothetical protein